VASGEKRKRKLETRNEKARETVVGQLEFLTPCVTIKLIYYPEKRCIVRLGRGRYD